MKVIDLAIIIPTLNEEHYIGVLLDSLAMQSVQPREIVIVDANSKDKTKTEVAKRKQSFPSLLFFNIAKKTIGRQRNYGVARSNSAHILFLDADMFFQNEETLEVFYKKIHAKKVDAATAFVMPAKGSIWDSILYGSGNIIAAIMQWIKPAGTTMNLYITRSMFEYLGGFDEDVVIGEDFELLTRLGKAHGKFGVFLNPVMYTSVRRMEYEGRIQFIFKLFRSTVQTKLHGYKNNPIPYKFGHFSKKV